MTNMQLFTEINICAEILFKILYRGTNETIELLKETR